MPQNRGNQDSERLRNLSRDTANKQRAFAHPGLLFSKTKLHCGSAIKETTLCPLYAVGMQNTMAKESGDSQRKITHAVAL